MKKGIVIALIGAAALLAGCEETVIVYEGKEMPRSEAEERIADQLEVENPELDLEVRIVDESDE